jgi:hypothetical protein
VSNPQHNGASVTVQICNGLGNQLFQYATARALSLRSGVPLVLDNLSGFPRDFYRRNYQLHHFKIDQPCIDPSRSYATLAGRIRRRIDRALNRNRHLERKTYIQEMTPDFEPRLAALRVTRRVFLDGNWQHEDYFREFRDVLLRDFTMATAHEPANVELAKKIESVSAVCLHVRRLHGVPNVPKAAPLQTSSARHVDPSYYTRAVEALARRVERPHFFVFSDFPDWARENVRIPFPVEFVTHNGADRDYEDFWLMGLCRHFIIANSTFSWWAAWLANNPEKIVVAPRDAIGLTLKSVPASWQLM